MTTSSRTTRITTVAVAAGVAVLIGAVAFGTTRGGSGAADAAPGTGAPTSLASAPSSTDPSVPTSPTASPTPTVQATTSAPLQSAAPITSTLTAEIVSMQAVRAEATQPGEVGGPAVRFRIRLTNAGTKPVDLSSAVVNVYSGVDQAPAYQLDSDGIVFPSSVGTRSSVTGTAVFTIPVSDRGRVQVTVDTSATTTVVAFTGAAPK